MEAKRMAKVRVLPLDRGPQLMDMQPFNFVMDLAHLNDQLQISDIGSLSQLPYWVDDQAWVERYYEETRHQRKGS
jgi:hypothetical protein